MDECFICQQGKHDSLVFNPTLDALEKLLSRTRERESCKDSSVSGFANRMENYSAQELLEKNVKYHNSCYSSFANADKVSQKRFRDLIEAAEGSVIKRKAGRPSTVLESDQNQEKLITRSQTTPYNKELCIICQKPGKNIHKVSTNDTGELMLKVSEKLPDKSLFRRLNSIASAKDAVANDVLYHNLCWASIKQKALNKREKIEDYSIILADIEIIRFIESKFEENKKSTRTSVKIIKNI